MRVQNNYEKALNYLAPFSIDISRYCGKSSCRGQKKLAYNICSIRKRGAAGITISCEEVKYIAFGCNIKKISA